MSQSSNQQLDYEKFTCGDAQEQALKKLKEYLVSAPILTCLDFEHPSSYGRMPAPSCHKKMTESGLLSMPFTPSI